MNQVLKDTLKAALGRLEDPVALRKALLSLANQSVEVAEALSENDVVPALKALLEAPLDGMTRLRAQEAGKRLLSALRPVLLKAFFAATSR